jgi:hypothetical protein
VPAALKPSWSCASEVGLTRPDHSKHTAGREFAPIFGDRRREGFDLRASVPHRAIALLDISLNHIDARNGPLTVAYEDIIVGALIVIGLCLSFMVLPDAYRKSGVSGEQR